ncbi:hypothetical protein ACLKA6_018738 [Drosophila palustris]
MDNASQTRKASNEANRESPPNVTELQHSLAEVLTLHTTKQTEMMSNALIREKQVLEEACRIATESVTNVRTIAGLRREAEVIKQYTEEIQRVEILIR